MSEERIHVSGDEPQLGGEGYHFSGLEPEVAGEQRFQAAFSFVVDWVQEAPDNATDATPDFLRAMAILRDHYPERLPEVITVVGEFLQPDNRVAVLKRAEYHVLYREIGLSVRDTHARLLAAQELDAGLQRFLPAEDNRCFSLVESIFFSMGYLIVHEPESELRDFVLGRMSTYLASTNLRIKGLAAWAIQEPIYLTPDTTLLAQVRPLLFGFARSAEFAETVREYGEEDRLAGEIYVALATIAARLKDESIAAETVEVLKSGLYRGDSVYSYWETQALMMQLAERFPSLKDEVCRWVPESQWAHLRQHRQPLIFLGNGRYEY